MLNAVLFWIFGILAVLFGFLVFRVDSMARATFALLASFLFVAGEVLLLGLSYLGVVIILMMVMEMVIMAVFMIMYMMNPAGLMPMSMYHNKTGAMSVSVGTFVVLGAGIFLVDWPERSGSPPADPARALGKALMGPQMLTMMTLGLALFATIVASVVLATNRGRYERFGDDLGSRRPDDPIPGGIDRATTALWRRR